MILLLFTDQKLLLHCLWHKMEHASEYYEKAMTDLKTTVDLKSFPTVIKLEEKLLTLATYNIRNTTDRYVERRACLLSTIVAAFKSHRFAALGLQVNIIICKFNLFNLYITGSSL